MASDASVYNLANHPTVAMLDPYEVQARQISIRNALAQGALQQQSLQGGALDLQMKQRAIADEAATRAAIQQYYGNGAPTNAMAPGAAAPAPAAMPAAAMPNTAGLPASADSPAASGPAVAQPGAAPALPSRPPVPTMADLIRRGVPPAHASALIEQFQKVDQTSAEIDSKRATAAKANQEVQDAVAQQGSDMANMLVKSATPGQPINPDLLTWHLQHFASLGAAQAQAAQQVGQHLAQLAPADQVTFLKSLAGTPKTLEANAASDTASEKLQTSNQAAFDKRKADLAAALGSAQNQGDWNNIIARADPKVVSAMNIAPAFSAANQRAAVMQGQSANEQITTAQTARRDAATAANEARRASIEEAKFRYQQSGGDFTSNPAFMSGVVNGEIKINPRDKNFAAISATAKEQDPTWTSDRYDTRQHFTQSITSGPLSRQLQSINQGLAHLGEYKGASDKVGIIRNITPGMSYVSGDVKQMKNAADTAGHELTTMFSQGQGTQHEVEQTQSNLGGLTQDARNAGVNGYAKLVGGRLRAIAKQYVSATGEGFPVDRFVDSGAVDLLKSEGIDAYKIANDEAKTWMESRQGGAPGAAPAPAGGAGTHPAALPVGVPHVPAVGSTFGGQKVLSVTRVE